MLKLTKTGIGLLTRQYRSVLHKCFLINVGLFALGAATIMMPSEAEANPTTPTADEILSYLGTVSDGVATGSTGHTTWTQSGSAASAFAWETTNSIGSGVIKIGDYYYTYTYEKPGDYSVLTSRKTTTSAIDKKLYTGISVGSNKGSLYSNCSSGCQIIADFIKNTGGSSTGYTAGLYNNATITTLVGDFIYNRVGNSLYGNNINNITADFIGNNADSAPLYVGGGTIGSIRGNFIGNTTSSNGGGIDNSSAGTINSLTGNFIGNTGHLGGAIISGNGATIKLFADTQDIIFYDNKSSTPTSYNASTYHDIYNYNSGSGTTTLYLNAASGHEINFGGTITGNPSYVAKQVINLNTDGIYYGGTYNFNNAIHNQTINLGSSGTTSRSVSVKLGTIKQSDGTKSFGNLQSDVLVNYAKNSILDMRNGNIDNNTLSTLTLNNQLKLAIDANLSSDTADTLKATTVNGTSLVKSLIIDAIDTGSVPDDGVHYIKLTDNETMKTAYTLSDNIMDNITGMYADIVESVEYDETSGMLKFTTSGGDKQGRIHGLVEDMGDGTYTYHTTDMGDIVKPYSNLAIGTTVEEDFLSLNSVIGGWNANDRTLESGNVAASHLVNKEISTEPGANNITTDTTSVGANLVRLDTAILEAEDKLNTDYYTKFKKRHIFKVKDTQLDWV